MMLVELDACPHCRFWHQCRSYVPGSPRPPTPREAELLDRIIMVEDAHSMADGMFQLKCDELGASKAREVELTGQVRQLREALREAEKVLALCHTREFKAPEDAEVLAIGRSIGFGALISAASKCWKDEAIRVGRPGGEQHTAGPCEITVRQTLAIVRAALEEK